MTNIVPASSNVSGPRLIPGVLDSSSTVLSLFGPPDQRISVVVGPSVTMRIFDELVLWEKLCEEENRWDAIVATHKMQRFYETSSEADLDRFFSWALASTDLLVVSAAKKFTDPSRTELGPWFVPKALLAAGYLTEIRPAELGNKEPLIVASNRWLRSGVEWLDSSSIKISEPSRDLSEPVDTTRPRTFLVQKSHIVKTQLGSLDFFDSVEILAEARALSTIPEDISRQLQLPEVKYSYFGDAVSTLSREAIAGNSLVEAASAKSFPPNELMRAVINEAQRYARCGIFHNDIRPWNVIWTNQGRARFVDFSRLSQADEDARGLPQVIALIATLDWIARPEMAPPNVIDAENFDKQILDRSQPIIHELGYSVGALYGTPWHKLGDLPSVTALTNKMSLRDLIEYCLPRGGDLPDAP